MFTPSRSFVFLVMPESAKCLGSFTVSEKLVVVSSLKRFERWKVTLGV
jgi:hypothetical protein